MRDLLWRCDEHRGPDADFPALRGRRVEFRDRMLPYDGGRSAWVSVSVSQRLYRALDQPRWLTSA